MAKQVLRSLDVAALAVALDRAEEAGLTTRTPAPKERPGECVYLKYVGNEQLGLLTTRLPHVLILQRTPGGAGRNKKYVVLFDRSAVLHVLGFLLEAEEVARCTALPGHRGQAILACAAAGRVTVVNDNNPRRRAGGCEEVEQKGIEPSTSALRTLRSPN